MVAERLKQCLQDKANELRGISEGLKLEEKKAAFSLNLEYSEFDEIATALNSTISLIDAREDAYKLLEELLLPSITDPMQDLSQYGRVKIPFNNARLLAFQSYISIAWTICDLVMYAIAPLVLGDKPNLKDSRKSPNFLKDIVRDYTKAPKDRKLAYYNSFILHQNYGWSVAISYAIRNRFIHEGAHEFFEGRSVGDRYKISAGVWQSLEDEMQDRYSGTRETHTRIQNPSWDWDSSSPQRNDLLKLLKLCNDEIDEALGCLVCRSVGALQLQVKYLLERDNNL